MSTKKLSFFKFLFCRLKSFRIDYPPFVVDAFPLNGPNGHTYAGSLLSASGISEGMKTGMVGLSSYTAVEKRYGDSIVEFVEKLLPLDGGG